MERTYSSVLASDVDHDTAEAERRQVLPHRCFRKRPTRRLEHGRRKKPHRYRAGTPRLHDDAVPFELPCQLTHLSLSRSLSGIAVFIIGRLRGAEHTAHKSQGAQPSRKQGSGGGERGVSYQGRCKTSAKHQHESESELDVEGHQWPARKQTDQKEEVGNGLFSMYLASAVLADMTREPAVPAGTTHEKARRARTARYDRAVHCGLRRG